MDRDIAKPLTAIEGIAYLVLMKYFDKGDAKWISESG